ncbi:MAG: DUF58 domain-containing protein [Candidatus Nanohaloarchaea archaeon]
MGFLDPVLNRDSEELDETMSRKELRDAMDAEVKRISDLFRFVLKYQRHFQPSGVEFSGLRQYLPSDDASRIDWKNSAGTPELYVKQYEEELDMDIFIVLDTSDTMTFGTADKLKSEYSAVVTAALAFASVDAGINVGITMRGDETTTINPGGGNDQYQRILDELTRFENYGGTFDFEDAMNDVVGKIKDNTAIFVISDFLEVEGDWKTKMTLASLKFRHVMSVMVRDRRDYKLPRAGNFRFESPDGSKVEAVNTNRIKERFNREAERQEKEIEEKIKGAGSSFMKIDTRDNFAGEFAAFFDQDQGEW